jgi:RNA polymerase sigma-70 factor (ECF subfamily)
MSMVKPWETDLSVYADEATLLEGLRRKDREACTCLLKHFAPRLYRLALQLMGDPDEAEDVLQEGFIQACAHIDGFEGRSGLGTWLHRIVRNAALGHLRRKSPATATLVSNDTDANAMREVLVDPGEGPGEAVLARERGDVLERAIMALPDGLRTAFVLRDLEGMSTKEAAQALGITESAVKVRLHRARAALRASLAGAETSERVGEEMPLPARVERRLLDQVCPTATSPMPRGG